MINFRVFYSLQKHDPFLGSSERYVYHRTCPLGESREVEAYKTIFPTVNEAVRHFLNEIGRDRTISIQTESTGQGEPSMVTVWYETEK